MKGLALWVVREVRRARSVAVIGVASLMGALWLSEEVAMATPGDSATDASASPRVELRVMGTEQAVALTRSTSQELFDRLGVDVYVRSVSDPPPELPDTPLAVATIEITPPLCSIVIVDGRTGAELDRRTFSESSVETAVEAAAHIAYFVVETLLEPPPPEQTHPVEPAAPPPVAPTPTPPPAVVTAPAPMPPLGDTSSTPVGLDLGLAFSAVGLGGSRLPPGAGLTAELRFPRSGVSFGALMAVTTHASTDLEFEGATADLRPSTLRLLGTLDTPLGSALAFTAAFGGGVEWLRLTPTSNPANVEVADAQSVFDPLISGLVGLRIKLGDRTFLSALGGVDLSLAPKTFQAKVGDETQDLLEMPPLRPVFLLGAAASLDEAPRFGTATETP